MKQICLIIINLACIFLSKQLVCQLNKITNPDTYTNPIIHADYSDPDAIRVGEDYYMIASSFNAIPGLPILHSKDLVHWNLISYAVQQNIPVDHFSKPQHGNGIWAPSIRYHKNEFYIYYPDPDFGIYLIKSKNIMGPWTAPVLVEAGKGLIDPCVLWDDDGKNYLVHAYAGSRAGFKSVLVLKPLNAAADKVTGNAVLLFDGHKTDPTIEGPKIYKYNNWYYIFAPGGGVSTGWQTVLRSKNIYGPYERKVVLEQGTGKVNGPHQGAWVQTPNGEHWFIHFQDKGAYGRIVHLQPMHWQNNWPVMGIDTDGNGIGEPVASSKKPYSRNGYTFVPDNMNDEFNNNTIGLQWQWQANPKPYFAFCYPSKGVLRLNAVLQSDSSADLWNMPNLLLQKFNSEKFTATTSMLFSPKTIGERVGMVVMGLNYQAIELVKKADGLYIQLIKNFNADKGNNETVQLISKCDTANLFFKVDVQSDEQCTFSYSLDNKKYIELPGTFKAREGKWIGVKIGVYCTGNVKTNDAGYVELNWFRIQTY